MKKVPKKEVKKYQNHEGDKYYQGPTFDKAIFIQNESGGWFNNGGFFTAFSDAIFQIATDKKLSKLELKLMMLILSYLGKKEMMITPNVQRLLGVADYDKELGYKASHKGHVTTAFKKLEELGYIKRDKKRKDLHILINPAVAYNGKTKDFNNLWNQMALPFGNPPRKEPKDQQKGQDWDSHLLDDLEEN